MRSLASLLEGAARRGASEVVLESGQPIVYTTARGAEAEATELPRTDLFDMLLAAVDDAQQIELAVGNPVEFLVAAGADWTVHAEPGQEGILVRARRKGGPELEIDLEYAGGGYGFEVEEPQFDVGLTSSVPSARSRPGSGPRRPRMPSEAPPSQLYVEALDTPMVDESGPISFDGKAVGAAFESGTWALDDDFDVGLDEAASEDSLPTGFVDPSADLDHIGVPADDDDENFDPFADASPPPPPTPPSAPTAGERRLTHSPTVRAMEASSPHPSSLSKPNPPKLSPPQPNAPKLSPPQFSPPNASPPQFSPPNSRPTPPPTEDIPQVRNRDISDRVTRRDIGVFDASQRDPSGRNPAASPGLIADIAEGTLVFVREHGFADSLARASQAPSITVADPFDAHEVWNRVRALPAGAIIIVRCEDPSTLLDGILRRLEEGYRVFVETRARTVEGARRVLLGVSATERAERWLNAQTTLIVEPGEGGPQLVEA